MRRFRGSRSAGARTCALALILAAPAACAAPDASDDRGTEAAGAEGRSGANEPGEWITLFDGSDLSEWRGYRRDDAPAAWQIRDGLLAFVPGGEGGDLITRDQYGDFELELEWRVGPGGNSGIFYRAGEDTEAIWHEAPEMQVLDDDAHIDGGSPITSAGANYALNPPAVDVVRPAGEWNRVRIVARGPRIEHWLNGTRIVEYEVGSADWEDRVRSSKFVDFPGYGRRASGHIGLQDHGDPVWFRNIRIRPLQPGAETGEGP